MANKRKVVLVGTGFVGMSMAYALENQGGINELVLIDVLKDKAEGEAMDLSHGLAYAPGRMDIKATTDYNECKNADIVVITAGIAQKQGGQTRLELCQTNTKIVKEKQVFLWSRARLRPSKFIASGLPGQPGIHPLCKNPDTVPGAGTTGVHIPQHNRIDPPALDGGKTG